MFYSFIWVDDGKDKLPTIWEENSPKNYINVKDYSNTQEEFTIVSCETTNFLFTNPRPLEKDISKYYDFEDYISHSNKKNDF